MSERVTEARRTAFRDAPQCDGPCARNWWECNECLDLALEAALAATPNHPENPESCPTVSARGER